MSEVVVLQHVECETIGSIQRSLTARQVSTRVVRLFDGDAVPSSLAGAGGLIVMGGPMGVYEHDRFPFLRDEIRLIAVAVRDGKPVLGICLGSQLLAAALGAKVRPSGQQEIGWHPVSLSPAAKSDPLWKDIPTTFTPLHWHGDIFDLPEGAELLASSKMTAHQAFRIGSNAYGLLFHLEVTESGIERMADTFPDDLAQVGLTSDTLRDQSKHHLPNLHRIREQVFGRWLESVVSSKQ